MNFSIDTPFIILLVTLVVISALFVYSVYGSQIQTYLFSNSEYQTRSKLLKWAKKEQKSLDSQIPKDVDLDLLDPDEDYSAVTLDEKVKVMRASNDEDLSAQWKAFKANKPKDRWHYFVGEIYSIQKKKIKTVGNELQIKVFYKEVALKNGMENSYARILEFKDKIDLCDQLEDIIDDVGDYDEKLADIIADHPILEKIIPTLSVRGADTSKYSTN